MYYVIFFLLMLFRVSSSTLNCKCNKQSCRTPTGCSHGLVWDHCYCCLVCGKGEGELCGGKDYTYGECGGAWQQCVVRDTRNYLNRYKEKSNELIGRCEQYSCAFENCPFGQRCTIKDGYTHCHCNISCSGMMSEPVCGEVNNKHYKNECELRKEECQTGKRIGISITPCQGSNIARVLCSTSIMKLALNRKIFGRRWPRRLALNDPSCRAVVNKTHVTVSTLYNRCGTKTKYTLTSIIFSNTLRTLPPRNAFIRRGKQVSIPFKCEFQLRSRNRNHVRFTQSRPRLNKSKEPGKYTKKLTDGSYVEIDTTRNYTIILKTVRYKGMNIKLMPLHCYATPLQRGYRNRRFVILDKGCPVERNVIIKSFTNSKIILQIPGIRFKQMRKSGANIRCKVRSCVPNATDEGANCQANCETEMVIGRRRREIEPLVNNFKQLWTNLPVGRKPIIIQGPEDL